MRTASIALLMLIGQTVPQPVRVGVITAVVLEDRSGEPVAAANVRLSDVDGKVIKEVETGPDGRFAIRDLAQRQYRVAITKRNYASLQGFVSASSEGAIPLVFRLVRGGVITGHIFPAQSGRIVAIEKVPDGQVPRTFQAEIDRSGEYRLFGIPPGRYA